MDNLAKASEDAFRDIYARLKQVGKKCSPRGQLVIEAENFTYELPAYVRFPSFEARKLSPLYIKSELLWYLRANQADTTITKYAAMWTNLVNKDVDGIFINSNYGQYVFGNGDRLQYASPVYDENQPDSQFDAAARELCNDKDSRRASIVILQPRHLFMKTNDVPCTYTLNFRIREDKLNISVHMRSQDAIFGMGNDAPAFSVIHEMMYVALRDTKYPELQLGTYHHICDSFHVYERHFEVFDKINAGDPYIAWDCPMITSADEVRHLRGTVHLLYPDGDHSRNYRFVKQAQDLVAKSRGLVPTTIINSVDAAHESFPFSKWLVDGALEAHKKHLEAEAKKPIPTDAPAYDGVSDTEATPNVTIFNKGPQQ